MKPKIGTDLVPWTWDQLGFPRDLNVETRKDTHNQETNTSVPHTDIQRGDEHDGTDSRKTDRPDLWS